MFNRNKRISATIMHFTTALQSLASILYVNQFSLLTTTLAPLNLHCYVTPSNTTVNPAPSPTIKVKRLIIPPIGNNTLITIDPRTTTMARKLNRRYSTISFGLIVLHPFRHLTSHGIGAIGVMEILPDFLVPSTHENAGGEN